MKPDYDVIILGAGAAGLSAGLYTTRAMMKTLILESLGAGGQLLITDEIENYPGFPKGVKGQELSQMMEEQTTRFGAEIEYAEAESVDNLDQPVKVVRTYDKEYTASRLIIATGGSHNKLGVTGEDEFAGRGVSYCAVCDGNFFRGQDVVVVGGGDGGSMREVLKHGSVEQAVLVDIDDAVTRVVGEWLPQMTASLADPRVDRVGMAGAAFLAQNTRSFDAIIVDSTDPGGPATELFTDEF